jgi:hypothetical protein
MRIAARTIADRDERFALLLETFTILVYQESKCVSTDLVATTEDDIVPATLSNLQVWELGIAQFNFQLTTQQYCVESLFAKRVKHA